MLTYPVRLAPVAILFVSVVPACSSSPLAEVPTDAARDSPTLSDLSPVGGDAASDARSEEQPDASMLAEAAAVLPLDSETLVDVSIDRVPALITAVDVAIDVLAA
jgi:hypothetical protein